MNPLKPIHPFPARMAPEIALAAIADLSASSTVLDPMTGSGVAVRFASDHGHRAFAFDRDPLAALMTRVWTTPICTDSLQRIAQNLTTEAVMIDPALLHLPWIDNDLETSEFVNYWFDLPQQRDLRRLSSLILKVRGSIADALMLALSRIIITKKRGASLAWDVSHSRPHRKKAENDFCVMSEFMKSVVILSKRLEEQPPKGNVFVGIGDARKLTPVEDCSVDAVITSPPYFNAIDYLRGHKFTLVWLGHSIGELRDRRAGNIGAERVPDDEKTSQLFNDLCASIPNITKLGSRELSIFHRYIGDLFKVMSEIERVLKSSGKAVLVIGNSCLKGVFVDNALASTTLAVRVGLTLKNKYERDLPSNRRYLPPPKENDASDLSKRMRTESVLTFIKH